VRRFGIRGRSIFFHSFSCFKNKEISYTELNLSCQASITVYMLTNSELGCHIVEDFIISLVALTFLLNMVIMISELRQ
jgi:hypothetical protein